MTFKPCLLSHLSTAGLSLREVGVNIRLLVLKSYRNGQTQTPLRCQKGMGGEVSYSTIQQAVLTECTGGSRVNCMLLHYKACQLTVLSVQML